MPRRENNIEAPRERVRAALAGALHDSLRPVLLALALLYVGFALSHWFSLPRPQGAYIVALEGATVAMVLAMWWFVGRIARPSVCTHPLAAAINILMLTNVYTRVVLLRDAHEALTVLPMLVGVGFFFLSTPWMLAAMTAAISAWVASGAVAQALPDVAEHRFVIVASALLGIVVHVVRVRMLTRVEHLRHADELRATELQDALEDSDRSRNLAEEAERELRKSLEALGETEGRYRDLFENAHDLIASFYADGRFVYFNTAWGATLGYDDDELSILRLADIVAPQHLDVVMRATANLAVNPAGTRVECDFATKDGRVVSIEGHLSARILRDGPFTIRGIFRDITQRREIERLKEELIATVSHELRTPLTSIQGALELVTAGAAGEVPEAAESLLSIAYDNGHRLVRIVDDILDISQIEAGQMAFNMDLVDVSALLRMALDANDQYAQRHGSHIRLEDHLESRTYVRADADRLLQVLANLLSNAAKFSPEGTEITLAVEARDDDIRITVQDRGDGVPEAAREHIFGKFMQVDGSATRAHGGAGLGLAISKAIVDRLAGTIGLDSESGRGASFHVTLPISPSHDANEHAGVPEPPSHA